MSEERRKNMNRNIQQESKTLEEAARPLVEYIRKYHTHDYCNSHRRRC